MCPEPDNARRAAAQADTAHRSADGLAFLATVVVRAKDEARAIGRTLDIVRSQTIADRLETVVVDSGSTDATAAIATQAGARVLRFAPEAFSYGRALNYGCEHARADVVVVLSAHAFPRTADWAERMLEPFADPRVACVCGVERGPRGELVHERVVQDYAAAQRTPHWGYSNHAGAFRSSLWRQRPFRADLPYTEDKEWATAWLKEGYVAVLDPELAVEHVHRESWAQTYRRALREWTGFAMFLDIKHYGLRDLIAEWWSETGYYDSRMRARISPRRICRLVGAYRGRRIGAVRRESPAASG